MGDRKRLNVDYVGETNEIIISGMIINNFYIVSFYCWWPLGIYRYPKQRAFLCKFTSLSLSQVEKITNAGNCDKAIISEFEFDSCVLILQTLMSSQFLRCSSRREKNMLSHQSSQKKFLKGFPKRKVEDSLNYCLVHRLKL